MWWELHAQVTAAATYTGHNFLSLGNISHKISLDSISSTRIGIQLLDLDPNLYNKYR